MRDDTHAETGAHEGDVDSAVPQLDEQAFLRDAKRASTRRMVLTSCAVAAVAVMAFVAVGWLWSLAIGARAQQIDDYYMEYVAIAYPNTTVMPGDTLVDFPGASRHYIAYRRVGDVAVPAGEAVIQFNLLGGGIDLGPTRQIATTVEGRNFSGSSVTAELEFIEPPRGGGTLADMMSADASRPDVTADTLFVAQAAAVREKSLARLAAAPASATVEMAVSFADVEKLD
ncbi:MAG: sigma factor regulator N-terminal domain-containing protein, partial [Coriobacteriia bacterium]|nr:sigma factor regulator N-terminal domain-containing protein [Coriobacteriia bacterium]